MGCLTGFKLHSMHLRPLHLLPLLALLAACASEPPPPPPPPPAYIVIMPEPCDPSQDPDACAYAAPAPAPDDSGDYGGAYAPDYSTSTPALPFSTGAPVVVVAPARPAAPPAHPAPPPKPKPARPAEPAKPCPRNSKACPLAKLRSWAPPRG